MRRLRIIIILAVSFTVLFVDMAGARFLQVDVMASNRYVALSGNDIGDCNSAGSPCRSIQYAVNQSSTGDTILVAQGTYTYNPAADTCTFLPPTGKSVVCIVDKTLNIFGGYTVGNWAAADPSVNLTVIDGQDTYRGLYLLGYNTTTTSLNMEGFTFQNGWTRGPFIPGDPKGFGGGMLVAGARVTLRDLYFKNNEVWGENTSAGAGGAGAGSGLAINWSQPGTSNLLERVTFEGNHSYGGQGPDRGGVAYGALFSNASVTIDHGIFINNQATAGNSLGSGTSGGLSADALGGAIGGGTGFWTLQHIIATGNQVIGGNGVTYAGGGFGGGIYVEKAASFSISDSFIGSNQARGGNALNGGFGAGGGLLVNTTSATIERVLLVDNCAIGGNSTSSGNAGPGGGGGLYLWATDTTSFSGASVSNTIISDNYVAMGSIGGTAPGGGGGGIQVQGQQATLLHTTIAQNRLGPTLVSGQGLLVLTSPGISSAVVNVNNSIIADHTVGATGAVAVLVQQGNTINFNRGLFAGNTVDTNAGGIPLPPGTINGLSTMLSFSSARFRSPGAPYYDYHLLPDSPAVDQATSTTLAIDIDRQVRPMGKASDIGADEYQENIFLPLVIR